MALEAQLQIRQNAMEVQEYLSDLFEWEKSIKKKEERAKASTPSGQGSVPGPRGRAQAAVGPAPQELQTPGLQPLTRAQPASKPRSTTSSTTDSKVAKSAAAHTYSSYSKWDKLDVDALIASDDEQDAPSKAPAPSKQQTAPSTGPSNTQSRPTPTTQPTPSSQVQIQERAEPSETLMAASTRRFADASALAASPAQASAPAAVSLPQAPSHPPVRNSEPQTADGWRLRGNDLFKAGACACRTHSHASQGSDLSHAHKGPVLTRSIGKRAEVACKPLMCVCVYVCVFIGQYAYARDCYTRCIQLDPDSAVAYANRAMAELKLSQWAQAEEDCTHALDRDPAFVKVSHVYMHESIPRRPRNAEHMCMCSAVFRTEVLAVHVRLRGKRCACMHGKDIGSIFVHVRVCVCVSPPGVPSAWHSQAAAG